MTRTGIRIRGQRGDPAVRQAMIRYSLWLRANYEFPIRVPVYLLPGETLITSEGQVAAASFFAPFNRAEEPYIRIATGDYPALKRRRGRNNAIAAFITSLSHEVIRYQQWIETGRTWESGVRRKAIGMLRSYGLSVHRP